MFLEWENVLLNFYWRLSLQSAVSFSMLKKYGNCYVRSSHCSLIQPVSAVNNWCLILILISRFGFSFTQVDHTNDMLIQSLVNTETASCSSTSSPQPIINLENRNAIVYFISRNHGERKWQEFENRPLMAITAAGNFSRQSSSVVMISAGSFWVLA
jgi:hypothetical protein